MTSSLGPLVPGMPPARDECDRCGEEVRVMGHVCDPAKVEARRVEAMAIATSGVAEDPAINWEEALGKLAQSQATVQGRERESAPEPHRTLGFTFFEWRVIWMLGTWGVLVFAVGMIFGRLLK